MDFEPLMKPKNPPKIPQDPSKRPLGPSQGRSKRLLAPPRAAPRGFLGLILAPRGLEVAAGLVASGPFPFPFQGGVHPSLYPSPWS